MSSKIGGKFLRRTDVKLAFLYILTFSLSALLITGFLYLRLKHQLVKEVDRMLLDETDELANALSSDEVQPGILKNLKKGCESRTYYPIYFGVLNGKGRSFYVSENLEGMNYTIDRNVLTNAENGKQTREQIRFPGRRRFYRFISTPIYQNGRLVYIVQTGTHLRFVWKSLSHFKWNIMAALPIVLFLGSLGGWILARKSLSPIGYIASRARRISSENLGERLTPRGTDDEMDDLIRTINDMMARLEGSFKRMAEFTADASHELKTPICAMRGEAEVLLSKGRPAEEYQEGLIHFIEQFEHLNRMINDLILLSKFDSSQMELKMAPLRLDLLLKDLCNFFQVLAEQNKIDLETGIIEQITVIGDKTRLQQLFTNLIDNAIKYTSAGSIRVILEENQNAALVKIRDTGIGIPEEEQENIFKRFYRVDKSRSKETGGVGLGLSIAEWIVRAHHGRIEVTSELGRGSTFAVFLPMPQNETEQP